MISLNRNQLKYIVVVAMLIDHIAWAFVTPLSLSGQIMHFVGRLTGPTMAYLIAEGYRYTRSRTRYAARLGVFALISWVPYSLFEYGRWPVFSMGSFGVIFTLFLGFLAVWLWDRAPIPIAAKVGAVLGLCALSFFGDWFVFDVLWPLFLFVFRHNRTKQRVSFWLVAAGAFLFCSIGWRPVWAALYNLGIFVVPLLLQFGYSGTPGSRHPFHKWFFYVFYPLHLFVLYALLRWW